MDDLQLQRGLGPHELAIFNAELQRHERNLGVSYALLIFLGWAGVHKFYLGEAVAGGFYLGLNVAGTLLVWGGVIGAFAGRIGGLALAVLGGLLLACYGIFWLVDLFTLPAQHRHRTAEHKAELLKSLVEREQA